MSVYRGVAHVHGKYSFDGRLALPDLVAFLKDRGMQFVLMSEHVETLTPEKIRSFIGDCERLSDSSFLMIPGIEIDGLHALFYNVRAVEEWEDYPDLARQLAQAGALVAVSHPVKVKRGLPEVTAASVEAVEIWNSRHDGRIAANEKIVAFWRSLQSTLNRPLVPLCGIDFHGKDDFLPLSLEVECDCLVSDEIMAALRADRHRITIASKPLPLNFQTGRLSFRYRIYSKFYRVAYSIVYAAHRMLARWNVRPPRRVKSALRRVF